MAGSANNVEISPVNLLWRIESEYQIDFAGLTGADVKGNSFTLYSAKDATQYYVWGDDSVVSDPADPGTGLPFTVTGDSDTAATLATACAAAITANPDFSASASGTVVTIQAAAVGKTSDAVDIDMGVSVLVCREGQDYDLGLLQDVVEYNLSPDNFVLQAQQFGVTPLAAIFRGYESIEATTTLLETDNAQLEEIYGVYGGSINPGTKVFGAGTSQQGVNLLKRAARLVAKPVNAADDLSNKVIALAIPVPDTLSFSGTDPRTLSVTWQGFVDTSKNTNINAMFFGDDLQDLS